MVSLLVAHRHGEFRPRLRFLAPGKRILHDDHLDLDSLTGWIADQHGDGRPVAVHCVTAAQLVVTIAALRAAGGHPGDRIEHAAVCRRRRLADLAEPRGHRGHPAQLRRRTRRSVPRRHSRCRAQSALAGGVAAEGECARRAVHRHAVRRGDPWAAMRAAVRRTTLSGAVLGADECVSARTALAMFLGHPDQPSRPRTVASGQPADLCVLTVPPADALAELDAAMVAATIIGGAVTYSAT